MGPVISKYVFPAPDRHYDPAAVAAAEDVVRVDVPVGAHRILGLLTRRRPTDRRFLIYSHGNAENLALSLGAIVQVSARLHCQLFAYEYTGYGPLNRESASEKTVYADISAVLNLVRAKSLNSGLPVVVYGRSLGSAPALYAAAEFPELVKAVVLECPFYSILSTRLPPDLSKFVARPLDLFKNYEHARKCAAPAVVLAGGEDTVVPLENSKRLFDELATPAHLKELVVLPMATHQDVWLPPNEPRARAAVMDFLDRLV